MSVSRLGGVRGGDDFDVPGIVGDDDAAGQAIAHAPVPAQVARGERIDATAAAQFEAGKLLTKKMAGEGALHHHLAGRVGPKYEAKVIPGPDRDHYLVKLHRRAAQPPFATEHDPETVYRVDRRDGKIALAGAAAKPSQNEAAGANRSLGELARPGKTLRDTTQTLPAGGTLRFTTRENQIFGLGEIKVDPRGGLDVKRKLLEGPPPGRLGGTSLYEYTLSLPAGARAGTSIKVATGGHFQTRNDPDWAFSFAVSVGGSK